MNSIKCDKCNNAFSLEAKDIKAKVIDDIEVQYFECKHCNEKYITTCVDDYIRKEQRRYKKLMMNTDKIIEANKCLKNMKIHSDRLKLKVLERV